MPPRAGVDVLVREAELQEVCTRILGRLGLDSDGAALVASSLVESDLRGVHSHGVMLMSPYVQRLRAGGINPRPRIRVIRETASTALLDGDHGPGQIVAREAMRMAIAKAGDAGTGVIGAVASNHYAAGARWAMMALERDFIGMAMTNAGAAVAPWGGTTPLLGTNPWTVAVPAGAAWPFVLDMATSVVPANKLQWASKLGDSIPLGWALDGDGQPTTDPRRGLAGRLLPVGAHKGYGLALMVELFTGILTGGPPAVDSLQSAAPPAQSLGISHYFQAIDVRAFMPPGEFKVRVDALVDRLKRSDREPGVPEILMPGEIEFRLERQRRKEGIPMPSAVLAELHDVAREQNVPVPWLATDA